MADVLADAFVGPNQVEAEHVLMSTARVSLQRAIDLLALAGEGDDEAEPGALAELVAFCARASAYWAAQTAEGSLGDGTEFFAWLRDVEEDEEFLDRLHEEVADWEQRTHPRSVQVAPGAWESFGVMRRPARPCCPRGVPAARPEHHAAGPARWPRASGVGVPARRPA